MECTRYQTDGMRLIDDELSQEERFQYQAHVRECEVCSRELDSLGRVVRLTGELKLRVLERLLGKRLPAHRAPPWICVPRRRRRHVPAFSALSRAALTAALDV